MIPGFYVLIQECQDSFWILDTRDSDIFQIDKDLLDDEDLETMAKMKARGKLVLHQGERTISAPPNPCSQ